MSRDAAVDDADATDFGLSATGGLGPLPTSNEFETSALILKEAMATQSSEVPQVKLVTTQSSQSPHHLQHEDFSTACVPNNRPPISSAPLSQGITTNMPDNRCDQSSLILSVLVSSTGHTSKDTPNRTHRGKRMTFLELPLDIMCLVVDQLDVVARTCLKYAHRQLDWVQDISNLGPCPRIRIVRLLEKDGDSIPKELLGAAGKGTTEHECSHYFISTYCVICRCRGHLSRCPRCRIRTCAREDTGFWQKWTRVVDDDTAFTDGEYMDSRW